MVTETNIYWITRLDGIKTFLGVSLGFAILVAAVSLIVAMFAYDERDWTSFKFHVKSATCTTLVSIAIGVSLVFIPSTKDMCAIKVLPLMANNEKVRRIGSKTLDLTDRTLTLANALIGVVEKDNEKK